MARFTLKSVLVGVALVATLGSVSLPKAVQAQAPRVHLASRGCTLTVVDLHGTDPATWHAPQPSDCNNASNPDAPRNGLAPSNGVSPDQSPDTNCSPSSMFFYSDINKGGQTLCVNGSGWLDLGGGSWNDTISSFVNGNTFAGNAYENNQAQGLGAHIPVYFRGSVMDLRNTDINGTNYGNWNDRISEICADGAGVGCPPRS